jgi:alkylated DNA nucleotide flippase Atl1
VALRFPLSVSGRRSRRFLLPIETYLASGVIASERVKSGLGQNGRMPRRRSSIKPETAAAGRVLARARSVPPGRVTTYGDLSPSAPRYAGAVLAACEDPGVPWHRVVRADGSLAKGARQRALLEAEAVPFRGRRVDLEEAWWEPQD